MRHHRLLLLSSIISLMMLATPANAVGKHGLEDFDSPWPAETYSFETQQQTLDMRYMVAEPDEPSGKAALLLHGKNFCGHYWESTAEFLVEHGYRVIIPEQIGFCRSSLPERYQFSFHQLADNTARLLDELDVETVDVIGHSMGGMLATRFALMFPNRADQLVLLNPIGLEDWLAEGVPWSGIDALYQSQQAQDLEGIIEYQKQAYYDGHWNEDYEYWARMLAATYEGPRAEQVAWNHALTADMVMTQPVLYEFPRLEVPTGLIIGLRDRTAPGRDAADPEIAERLGHYPRLGKEAADAIPDAELIEFDDVGHMPQFEAPDRYRAALSDILGLTTP